MAKKSGDSPATFEDVMNKWKDKKRAHYASETPPVKVIPIRIWEVDHLVLGSGGLPKGFMTEVSGDSGTGKTTLSLQALAACQQAGGKAALVDIEGRYDEIWAEKIGVDTSTLGKFIPESGEEAYTMIRDLIGNCDLVVVDSIAGMMPKSEMEKDFEDVERMASRAKMHRQALTRLAFGAGGVRLRDSGTSLFLINQRYANIGVMYGEKTKSSGGGGPEYNAQVRLRTGRAGTEENLASFTVKCSKIGAALPVPFFKTTVVLDMVEGYFWPCELGRFIEAAKATGKYGECDLGRRWIKFNGNTYGSKAEFSRYLRDNYQLVEEIIPVPSIVKVGTREYEEED